MRCIMQMLLILLVTTVVTIEAGVSPEALLISHLKNTSCYNQDVRPVLDPETTLAVYVRIALSSIKALVEKDLTMTSVGWLVAVWQDELLQWDPADWSGITKVVLPARLVWKPELNVINSVHRSPDWGLNEDTRVVVHANGIVDWRINFLWYTNCKMNLRKFPFDTQKCTVKIGSWTYNFTQMELTLVSEDIIMFLYEENSEWSLEHGELLRETTLISNVIHMELTLKRHPAYYVLNIVAPAMLISLMTLLIFRLPHESGEKVSLGVTVLLSFTVVMLSIIDVSPKGGDGIPIIAMYIVISLVIAGLSVALSIVTSVLFHQPGTRAVPDYLWVLLARKKVSKVQPTSYGGWMAKQEKNDMPSHESENRSETPVIELKKKPEDPISGLLSLIREKYQEEEAMALNRQNWRQVAVALDCIFFWIITLCVACSNMTLLLTIMMA